MTDRRETTADRPTKTRTPQWIAGIAVTVVIGALLAVAGSDGTARAGGVAVFALCVALAFAINWVVFVPSFLARTETYFDLTGALTYLTVTAVALVLSDGLDARAWVAAALVWIWALRLGSFLFRRVRRDGGDGRFDRMKHDAAEFLMTWTIQGLWVSLTLAAALVVITADERADFGALGVIGLVIWVIGFAIEVVADTQKSAFKADPANEGRFISTGLWAWSRHPNYFGEIVLWLGIAIIAVPVLSGWRWVALISPIFVYLLITRVSGVPMLEKKADDRWGDEEAYQRYKATTPELVPRPPRS